MPGVWTRREVESLADPRSFLRGVGYQRDGRVEVGDRDGDAVTAVVRGSMPYYVELVRSPEVAWSCNCPVGEEGTCDDRTWMTRARARARDATHPLDASRSTSAPSRPRST